MRRESGGPFGYRNGSTGAWFHHVISTLWYRSLWSSHSSMYLAEQPRRGHSCCASKPVFIVFRNKKAQVQHEEQCCILLSIQAVHPEALWSNSCGANAACTASVCTFLIYLCRCEDRGTQHMYQCQYCLLCQWVTQSFVSLFKSLRSSASICEP